jgi:hypothetical protein
MIRQSRGQRYVVIPNFPRAAQTKQWKQKLRINSRDSSFDMPLFRPVNSSLLIHYLSKQIFSRHEAILASHLEMLDSVKSQIAPDGEAFRTLSSMVTKTIQAVNQSKVARKQMVCEASQD